MRNCIACGKELSRNPNIRNVVTFSGAEDYSNADFCLNKKCSRYGLATCVCK